MLCMTHFGAVHKCISQRFHGSDGTHCMANEEDEYAAVVGTLPRFNLHGRLLRRRVDSLRPNLSGAEEEWSVDHDSSPVGRAWAAVQADLP
jgi:hypothetical protein